MRDRLAEILRRNPCEYNTYEGFADYLMEQGVVVLPVRLGGEIYDITEYISGEERAEILSERLDYFGVHTKDGEVVIETPDGADYKLEDFGEKVFTDKKEAERMAMEWRMFYEEFRI